MSKISTKHVSFKDRISSGTLLEKMMAARCDEWYDDKHRTWGADEVTLVNALTVEGCPFCGSGAIRKAGFRKDGIRLFYCKSCRRRFNPLSGTVFDSHKIPISEWIQFLFGLAGYGSTTLSSGENMNAKSTGKYWILKLFSVLEGCQEDTILRGTVTIDETFFPVVRGDLVRKGGKKLRGISRNQMAVVTGIDEDGRVLLLEEGVSNPTLRSTLRCLEKHIAQGSQLIHDGANCHGELIKRLGLTAKSFPSKACKGLPDERNPLWKINRVHFLLKSFMRRHSSFNRKNIQGWLDLFWAISKFKSDRMGLIRWILERSLRAKKIIRYRSAFSKKQGNKPV